MCILLVAFLAILQQGKRKYIKTLILFLRKNNFNNTDSKYFYIIFHVFEFYNSLFKVSDILFNQVILIKSHYYI